MKGAFLEENLSELTLRSILLAVVLTVVLAVSNAYLALKLGILTSASIPAAILSMGILRFFKNPSILENNAVQTAASAGEAVAGGIVYTIPALIIIQYWHHFDYLTNFLIAACGGVLGVLFSIPLRRLLVHEPLLKFPEGRAIAAVLQSSSERVGIQNILWGGIIGGVLELLQTGFKVIAGSVSLWFAAGRSLFGGGAGFSATMIGAGYLVGHDMAFSIFAGALLSWGLALPIISPFFPEAISQPSPAEAVIWLWNSQMRYMGIGAMLFAGIWTFFKLAKPLGNSIVNSLRGFTLKNDPSFILPRTDRDIPMLLIFMGVFGMAGVLYGFFHGIFPLHAIGLDGRYTLGFVGGAVLYVLVIGFFFSVITAYFSGMVGVTASPGSSVVIAGMLFAAWLLLTCMEHILPLPLTQHQLLAAEAMTIITGSIVTGIAAIANDNTQDLKVGQLVGATPWKQQLMLLLGVIVSALVIPPVMQLLFDVYGIAGVMPRAGMDISQSLPAPTAALMAAVTQAVFSNALPWKMMLTGALIIMGVLSLNRMFGLNRFIRVSILGVAIGMYLPLASSFPLFLGGMIALLAEKRLNGKVLLAAKKAYGLQKGTLIACGMVAGSALMDVVLAIAFSLMHSPDALMLVGPAWMPYGVWLAVLSTAGLAVWIIHRVSRVC